MRYIYNLILVLLVVLWGFHCYSQGRSKGYIIGHNVGSSHWDVENKFSDCIINGPLILDSYNIVKDCTFNIPINGSDVGIKFEADASNNHFNNLRFNGLSTCIYLSGEL